MREGCNLSDYRQDARWADQPAAIACNRRRYAMFGGRSVALGVGSEAASKQDGKKAAVNTLALG